MSTFNNIPSPSDMQQFNGYEKSVLHPAIAQWLIDNGYSYAYEVKIENAGRADFIASHPSGDTLIIEGKKNVTSIAKTIAQVKGYCLAYGNPCRVAIGIPEYMVTNKAQKICDKHNVALLAFNLPEDIPDEVLPDPFAQTTILNLVKADKWLQDTYADPIIAIEDAMQIYRVAGLSDETILSIFADQMNEFLENGIAKLRPNIMHLVDPTRCFARYVFVRLFKDDWNFGQIQDELIYVVAWMNKDYFASDDPFARSRALFEGYVSYCKMKEKWIRENKGN